MNWLFYIGTAWLGYKLLLKPFEKEQNLQGLSGKPKDIVPQTFDDLLNNGFWIEGTRYSVTLNLNYESKHKQPHVVIKSGQYKLTCFVGNITFKDVKKCCKLNKDALILSRSDVIDKICRILKKFENEIISGYSQNY